MASQGVVRGCGTREQGAAYMEVPTGPNGRSVEDFLIDPPKRVVPAALGLTGLGVRLFQTPGDPCTHVIDIVGSQHYPHVADFVEEVRHLGVSRKIARTTDFSGLGPGSKLYLVHANAWIDNHEAYYRVIDRHRCPKGLELHESVSGNLEVLARASRGTVHPPECCAGLWWHDLTGGSHVVMDDRSDGRCLRTIASVTYQGWMRPKGVEPSHSPAIFAVFPLVQIAVIRSADGSHELTEHAARQGKLPVSLEDS